MILLDSNTLIQYFRGVPSVVRNFQMTPRRELRIPSVVAYEVEYGAWNMGSMARRKATQGLLAAVPQVPFDSAAASESARIRIELERRGLMVGPLDLMIAGTATSRNAFLVTNNTAEFSRIKGLRLLDWTK
jgi:tRNA(fMet)-specific endonuclease VapC